MEIINVKSVEQKTTTNGKSYQLVIDQADKRYSNWGKPMNSPLSYKCEVETNDKGYHTIKSYQSMSEAIPETKLAPKPQANNGYTDSCKNRSMALSYAKDFACALISSGKDINSNDVLKVAETWHKWLTAEPDLFD